MKNPEEKPLPPEIKPNHTQWLLLDTSRRPVDFLKTHTYIIKFGSLKNTKKYYIN
jgi:hypothetical protein